MSKKLFNKPYLASTLDSQLDEAARKWIAHNAFGYHDGWFSNTLYINAFLDWYAFDFPNNTNGFNNDRIPEKYKGAAQFIAQYGNDSVRAKLANTTTVEIQPYNWSLNQRQGCEYQEGFSLRRHRSAPTVLVPYH